MAADPTPETESPDGTAPTSEAKGGRGKIIMLVAILGAIALGATVAYSQFGTVDRLINSPEDDTDDPKGLPPMEYGEFIQLEPLVVNPAETGGARFLMVSVALESAEAAVLEEVTMKDVVVRDAINNTLSQKTIGTLSNVSNRDAMKEEIRTLINSLLSEGEIDRLYFTQFMLQ